MMKFIGADFGERNREADQNQSNETARTKGIQSESHLLDRGSGGCLSASPFSPRDQENIESLVGSIFAIAQIRGEKNDNFVIYDCLPDPRPRSIRGQMTVCTVSK
jgi:hypothetical protein